MLHILSGQGVRFLRILWCDNANVIRAKAVHTGALDGKLEHGVGITAAQQAIPVMADAFVSATGLGPVGEVRLVPDWGTLTSPPYAPSHSRVMGDMVLHGQPWPYCPRDFVRRMTSRAAAAGFEVQAAFENEFYLLRADAEGRVRPADRTVFCSVQSMNLHQDFVNELVDTLIAQGIPVEQYYPESGGGQQEVTMRYAPALVAADRQIIYRESVHAVAARHNYKASFLPKIYLDQAGSGCHLHMSLWKDGRNLVSEGNGLSEVVQHFIAGILRHLPALMAITTPIPNSFRRIQPHFWSGAFSCWGMDNREAAVRVLSSPDQQGPTHFEVKTVDAASNPYLAMGAILAAGLAGVSEGLPLPPGLNIDPGLLSPSERDQAGVRRLPATMGEALGHLRSDSVLQGALGEPLARAYMAVKQTEWAALKDLELEQELELLLERY